MFTGIIQAVGKVREPEKLGDGVRLTIKTPAEFHLEEVHVGDSIAVNGACMTVTGIEGDSFTIDVSAESLSKTVGLNTFGFVNLEKAMRLGDRVDGVGQVEVMEPKAESWHLVILAPKKLSPYLAYKGSVTVNGVSLTINSVEDTPVGARISINLIPHTVEVTTLKSLKPQDGVNLEIDTIARYVERMISLRDNTDDLF